MPAMVMLGESPPDGAKKYLERVGFAPEDRILAWVKHIVIFVSRRTADQLDFATTRTIVFRMHVCFGRAQIWYELFVRSERISIGRRVYELRAGRPFATGVESQSKQILLPILRAEGNEQSAFAVYLPTEVLGALSTPSGQDGRQLLCQSRRACRNIESWPDPVI